VKSRIYFMWALIQGMKCETSVKTPGIPEHVPVPQETTPTMSKAPLLLGQTRGPPESPMQAELVEVPNPIMPGWIMRPHFPLRSASVQILPCNFWRVLGMFLGGLTNPQPESQQPVAPW